MILVDNNVLSSVAKIDRLDLLSSHFDTVATTTGVVEELNRDAISGYDFVDRIDRVKRYHGGWLHILSPTEVELKRAEEMLDETLSFTDAECIAIARTRELALLTDDKHVGEMAAQHDVEVWDLKLVLHVAILDGILADRETLAALIDELEAKDSYLFSERDRTDLFDAL